MKRRILTSLMLLLTWAGFVHAAADTEVHVLQDNGSRVMAVLPNNMLIVAQEMAGAPVVSAQVWLRAGSIHEGALMGKGISHYLEHLVSAGSTSTMTEEQSNALLGAMGAQTNAATGPDRVHYYINTTRWHTAEAIDRLADWVLHAKMDQKEVDREKAVITNEINMGQGDPGRILWKLTEQTRYQQHPARHPTIGYIDEFLSATREDIAGYYQQMYVPNNMVFVVAGDIDRHAVLKQVAGLFKDVPARQVPLLTIAVEPSVTSPRQAVGYADIQQPRLRLMWPGVKLGTPNDYALDLLGAILGQGESSRLVQQLRDQDKLVSSIDAYNASFDFAPGFFGVDAQLTPGSTMDAVRQAVLTQVTLLRDQPVTKVELARAKRKIMASIVQANQTAQGVASRMARDLLSQGDPDYLLRYAGAIQQLTAEDLQAAARGFLNANQLMSVQLLPLPQGKILKPAGRQTIASDAKVQTQTLNLNNGPLIAELEKTLSSRQGKEPTALEIDKPVWFTLDSGLRLIVQRSTLVPAVSMQWYQLGGLLGDKPGQEGIAHATATMMMKGAGDLSAQQIAAFLEDRGATLRTSAGNNTTYATASALVEDYPAVLELMAQVIGHPTFPAVEWAKLQPRLLAAIDNQTDRWSGELMQDFRQTYFGDHYPLSQSPLGRKKVVASLTAEALQRDHQSHLGADQAVLVVVGDVDPQTVKEQVASYFADLPPKARQRFNPPAPPMPHAGLTQFITEKPLAGVAVGLGPGLTRDSADYASMRVLSAVMSDFPSGWIQRALRGEGEGLVYAAQGYVFTGLVPGYYMILFNTTTGQAPQALSRTRQIIERARTEPINTTDLQRAKAKVLTHEFFGKQSNADRATQFALDELYGIDDPQGKKFLAKVEATDAKQLMRVAQHYLVHPVVVVMSDKPIDAQRLAPTPIVP